MGLTRNITTERKLWGRKNNSSSSCILCLLVSFQQTTQIKRRGYPNSNKGREMGRSWYKRVIFIRVKRTRFQKQYLASSIYDPIHTARIILYSLLIVESPIYTPSLTNIPSSLANIQPNAQNRATQFLPDALSLASPTCNPVCAVSSVKYNRIGMASLP